jgi:hypothetical protein
MSFQPVYTEQSPFKTDLMAGQNEDVGDVLVWNDGEDLYVKYVIEDTDTWSISETHLDFSTLDGVPLTKSGNPKVGNFDFGTEHDPAVGEFTYTKSLSELGLTLGDEVDIAAHAVVQSFIGYAEPNLDQFAAALPDSVTMSVQYPSAGAPSYFQTTIDDGEAGGLPEDMVCYGWCIDTDRVIYQNMDYTAQMYSSYEDLPEGLVEYPDNLDLVNYIINQGEGDNGLVGDSSGGYGNYTYGDVQRAIWALVEDSQSTSGLGEWNQYRVDEILELAYTYGEGFVPECGDEIAVILNPVNTVGDPNAQITIAQVTMAQMGVTCDPMFQNETAWAEGNPFTGNNWATFIAGYDTGAVV